MDPDPSLTSLKQRLELPGEIVIQLTAMKDENRRIRKDLELERRKVNRLSTAVKTLWDVVERTFPGGCTSLFHFLRFPMAFGTFRANADLFVHLHPLLVGTIACLLSFDR